MTLPAAAVSAAAPRCIRPALLGGALLVVAAAASADAAVIVHYQQPTPTVTALQSYTVDGSGDVIQDQSRDIRSGRNVAQTFQTATPITVASIYINVITAETNVNRTWNLQILEVANFAATTFVAGTVVFDKPITTNFTTADTSGTNFLQEQLTGSDIFTLPARNSGTTGYALRIVDDGGSTAAFRWRGLTTSTFTGRGYNQTTGTGQLAPNGDWNFALVIPEPGSLALAGVGGLLLPRRRRA